MSTVCIACNVISSGMINIYSHPNNVDKMFIVVSTIPEVKENDCLCIPCYDDLKIAYNFKQKCLQSAFIRLNSQTNLIESDVKIECNAVNNNRQIDSYELEKVSNNEKQLILSSGSPELFQYAKESTLSCKDFIDNFDSQTTASSNAETTADTGEFSKLVAVRNDITITNLFNCLPCGKSFTRSGNFRRHQRTIHMIGHKKTSKIGRNKHKRGPSPKLSENDVFATLKDTQCEYCFLNFDTEDLMKVHEEQHKSEEKPYKCTNENCSSQFKERFGLRKHLETHSNFKRFKCKFCDQRFHQIGNARSHERYHTGEKPYLCPHCGKKFAESGNLKAHIRFHTGERPYACPQCPKRFTTHYSHKIHIRSHTQERPYLCSDCGKSFKSSGKLLVHKRIHSGHRPYKCDVCPAAFVDNSGLKRHSRIH